MSGSGAEWSGAGAGREKIRWSVSGAEAEQEREGRGAVSGGYRKRRERWAEISTAPAPLTCSATYSKQLF